MTLPNKPKQPKQEQPTFQHPQSQSMDPANIDIVNPLQNPLNQPPQPSSQAPFFYDENDKRINFNTDLYGLIEVVSVIPTAIPKSVYDQVKIYTNGTSYRLYWYDYVGAAWHYAVSNSPLVYANTSVPAGNTVANTTSETAFSSSYTIAANSLVVGDVIHVKLWGLYGTGGIAPTLTGKIKFGSTVMLNTGALTCVINLTNDGWSAEADFIVTAIGSSGTIEAQGYAEFATAATTSLSVNVPNTAAITINTTTAEAITVTAQWSAASASNTITLREMIVQIYH